MAWLLACSGPTGGGTSVPDGPDGSGDIELGEGSATTQVTVQKSGTIGTAINGEIDPERRASGPASGPPSPDEVRIAAIERAVNETEAAQHECWAFAAADDFRVRGTMVLQLTFGKGRQADSVDVLRDEPGDARLRACVVELFQRYTWPAVFDAGQAIQLPLYFKTPRGQYTVAGKYAESRPLAGGKAQAAVLMHERNTGNSAGGMAVLTLQPGADTSLHWHNTATEILYVLQGQISVYTKARRQGRLTVKTGQALYIPPGVAHGTLNASRGAASVLQFTTPDGPQRHYLGERISDTVVARKGGAVPETDSKPILVRRPTVYPIAGGRAQVAFFFEQSGTGADAAYMGVMTAQPGVAVPAHRHPRSSEYLYVARGAGTMTVAGDQYPIGAATAVQIPADTEHSVLIEGNEPLVAVQFYTPSGPEQRFKQPPAKK